MSGMLGWITIGLVVGAIAKLVASGRDPGGLIVSALLGVAGAILAGLMVQATGLYAYGHSISLIGAVGGAAALILLYHIVLRVRG